MKLSTDKKHEIRDLKIHDGYSSHGKSTCDSICPFCKGDLCMHEYEDLLICKENLKWQKGITSRLIGDGKN